MEDMVVVDQLTKSYNRESRAVDGVSLRVASGKFVGLLGPNGAGKTTIMKMLTSLIRPDSGSAYIAGIDVEKNPREALSMMGAVVETPSFYGTLTARQTLRFLGRLRCMGESEIATETKRVLSLMNLQDAIDVRTGRYSRGMKQRLGIAQALLHGPRVLILDEPANGLDPVGIFEMRSTLMCLKRDGVTAFMSSHILSEVQAVCDEVAIISRGRLIAHNVIGDTPLSRVHAIRLRLLGGDLACVIRFLKNHPHVVEVCRLSGEDLRIDLDGTEYDPSALVTDLLARGFSVGGFWPDSPSLEDLYLGKIREDGGMR